MAETKFTPWMIELFHDSGHLGEYFDHATSIRYEHGSFEVRQRAHNSETGFAEAESRSRLIAQAPELYKAAKAFVDLMEHWRSVKGKLSVGESLEYESAKQAIAEVEGE